MPARAKGMTATEPSQAPPHAAQRPAPLDTGDRVTRTRRFEAATGTEQRRQKPLIGADQQDQRRRDPERHRARETPHSARAERCRCWLPTDIAVALKLHAEAL